MIEDRLSESQHDKQWRMLLQEAEEGRITLVELMRRSRPFFSFGQELSKKDLPLR